MFGSLQKSVEQKPLKDFHLSKFMYKYYVCIDMFYTPVEADVPKLSQVHMGHVRPKINDAGVVY